MDEFKQTHPEAPQGGDSFADALKARINPVIEDVKEKAAPVTDKVKDAARDAIDAVKEGAEKIGDFFSGSAPVYPRVKNEFFSELEQEANAMKDAAREKALEMQQMLEKMMGKKD